MCQVALVASDHAFLDHDSFVNCSEVIDSMSSSNLLDQLVADPARIRGEVSAPARSRIVEAVRKARTISPLHKGRILAALSYGFLLGPPKLTHYPTGGIGAATPKKQSDASASILVWGGASVNRTVGLRPALLVQGVYACIVGLLLLFPSLGSRVFAYPLKDPAVVSGWGSSLLGVGILALVAASDVQRYGGMAWAFVVGLLISAFDLLYFFITRTYTARNVIVPIIINALLIAWIWSVRPKR